ncbi:hypothetical protein [Alloactinosynnema sp. L-07]|uniref:DUF397 domain-containing protein n=1 Tax=Alloactinosynnema sp. L-07 TaxID=1653480 RepID=UPI00065EFF46|nr:DUF397 domain-containing protein [Alloactinosynnema sp. L-07]CRK60307.1 hypothetical protein [Alloactinosynnema sp. L-07]
MTHARWRKSSFGGGEQSDCVEVRLSPDLTHLRDSKNADGPTLAVTPTAWTTFVEHLPVRLRRCRQRSEIRVVFG